MSNLDDEVSDGVQAILDLKTANETPPGEDGDPFGSEMDEFVQKAETAFGKAERDDHDHSGEAISPEKLLGKMVGTRHSVPSGESVTIPAGYSEVVIGSYDLDGELTVNGRMEIL